MGASSNGNSISPKNKSKYYWEFKEINQKNNVYGTLKGIIYFKDENYQKGIQIKGIRRKNNREENFDYDGVFIKKKDNDIYYKIKYNENSKFKFPKEIIMHIKDKESAEIIGDILYHNNFIKLNLYLYLPKIQKDKSNNSTDNKRDILMKLNKQVNILSNAKCGMTNLINTCYMNSSFQILLHIPQFIEIIRENYYFKNNVIYNINYIFEMILDKFSEKHPVINPSIFVDNFKNQHLEYSGYSQKDTEMFLEVLIADINRELSVLDDKRIMYYYDTNTEKEILFYNYIKETDEDSYFKINDLFYVCFVHEKECYFCHDKSYYFDQSTGLKLNFEKTKKTETIGLTELIKINFENPIIFNCSFPCKKCNKCYKFIEKTRIAKLPKILILSLQKTDIECNIKIPWIVKFSLSENLNIKDLVDTELCKYGNCSYSLFAINNHIGSSPKSGHYYSLIYLESFKKWYCFNDEKVYQENDISPNLNNYILFYKQIK